MTNHAARLIKLTEIRRELKRMGCWDETPPVWVRQYSERHRIDIRHFWQWLQFIYLPNAIMSYADDLHEQEIIPQAMAQFPLDGLPDHLLQLLIELDNL